MKTIKYNNFELQIIYNKEQQNIKVISGTMLHPRRKTELLKSECKLIESHNQEGLLKLYNTYTSDEIIQAKNLNNIDFSQGTEIKYYLSNDEEKWFTTYMDEYYISKYIEQNIDSISRITINKNFSLYLDLDRIVNGQTATLPDNSGLKRIFSECYVKLEITKGKIDGIVNMLNMLDIFYYFPLEPEARLLTKKLKEVMGFTTDTKELERQIKMAERFKECCRKGVTPVVTIMKNSIAPKECFYGFHFEEIKNVYMGKIKILEHGSIRRIEAILLKEKST